MEIRVMTWNILSAGSRHAERAWEERREQVAELIRAHGPDLVGLQEVLPEQLDDLEELLPGYYRIGDGREGGGTGEFCPILYRADGMALLRDGTFWLSETPDLPGSIGWDAAQPRIVTWGGFRDQRTGGSVYHFNTHLDVEGSAARRNSIPLLHMVIDSEAGDAPVILTGDFNLTDDAREYGLIRGKRLRDAYVVARKRTPGPGGTFLRQGPGTESRSGRRIDYIFVSDGLAVRRYSVPGGDRDVDSASDHRPVVAELGTV